jgi:hypothetical protein
MTGHIDPNELGGFERRLLTALSRIDAQRQPAPHQAPVPTPQPRQGPRRPRRRRALLGAAVLAGLFALTTTAVATLYNPADLDVGGAAVPGGMAAVKGSGCQEGSTVTFTLDGKTRLGVTKAGTDGWFVHAELRIPAPTPLGGHTLTAVCTGGDGRRLVQQAKLPIVKTEPLPAPVAKSEPPPEPGGQVEPPPEPGGQVEPPPEPAPKR